MARLPVTTTPVHRPVRGQVPLGYSSQNKKHSAPDSQAFQPLDAVGFRLMENGLFK